MNYIPNLDFGRFLAAITVATCHFILSNQVENLVLEEISSLVVEYFFVLSGFVLAPQLIKIYKNAESKTKNTCIFLVRRWLRTIPPYLLALFLAATLYSYGDYVNFIKHALYLQNLFEDVQSVAFYPVGWSLSVEEWFYLLVPLILFFGLRKNGKVKNKDILSLIIIFMIFVSLLRGYFILVGNNDSWGTDVRRAALLRLDAICLGFISYMLYSSGIKLLKSLILSVPLYKKILCLIIIGVFMIAILFKNSQAVLFTYIAPVFFSFLVVLMVSMKYQTPRRISSYLGKISYPVYLMHLILLPFCTVSLDGYFIYLVMLIIFSTACYFGFERLFINARPKYYFSSKTSVNY